MFKQFAKQVKDQLDKISKSAEIFQTQPTGTDLFTEYLAAFPAGTNPIFRERTEHDCNCCKQFIRNLGGVVSVKDGIVTTVWDDMDNLPEPYATVARRMSQLVKQSQVVSVYRSKERSYGAESNRDNYDTSIVWNHFYGNVPARCYTPSPATEVGKLNTAQQVFKRGLDTLRLADVDEVINLVDQNLLVRGSEFKPTLVDFRKHLAAYATVSDKSLYAWEHLGARSALIRNTAIGTLLIDLADGDDLETAVRKYEIKVAGSSYKRPTALITPSMIKQALGKLRDLDLEHAVDRRHATISDISVNDVLFVDNSVAAKMKGGLEDLLLTAVAPVNVSSKPTRVSIDEFLAAGHKQISLVLNTSHAGNFVSLTAPRHASTGKLFRWNNDFAWSYSGEVADSIQQRVKAAGGNIKATMRCSLAWFNTDDLDLHCQTPSGQHIYYSNKCGVLDVDMNAGRVVRDPVENLAWTGKLVDGTYKISVNQFNRRENIDVGFTLQTEFDGNVTEYQYNKPVVGRVHVLDMVVSGGKLVRTDMHSGLVASGSRQIDIWGVRTGTPVGVTTIMSSPNHWDGAGNAGAKHWFFIIDGCRNPDPVRGIYNEFLRSDLDAHRKVFEVLGSKTKIAPADDQLSGVGFTSARGHTVTAIADNRTYEIVF